MRCSSEARQLARELAIDDREGALLHGDLHPGNVLDGGTRGLVAIDPRSCVGDPAFDVVDWVFWNVDADHWQTRSHDLAMRLKIVARASVVVVLGICCDPCVRQARAWFTAGPG